jgi:outer membrane lipoprotein-sorting protein
MKTFLFAATLIAFASSIGSPQPAWAVDPAAQGLRIAQEWNERDQGFGDTRAYMEMELQNRAGKKSVREMRTDTFEIADPNEGDKSLVLFERPRDVKGTAFLTFAHIQEADDQWLYLPALKRVKRISSKNKSGPFVGSEFAYEDLSAQELKKYTYKWLRDEACGDQECYVVEQIPTYKNSGYTRMVVWFDKAEYRQQKIDYYDRKKSLLKTLTYGDYRQYLEKYWRPHDMHMVNHQTGKQTRLKFEKIDFRTGLTDKHFSKNSLKRAR